MNNKPFKSFTVKFTEKQWDKARSCGDFRMPEDTKRIVSISYERGNTSTTPVVLWHGHEREQLAFHVDQVFTFDDNSQVERNVFYLPDLDVAISSRGPYRTHFDLACYDLTTDARLVLPKINALRRLFPKGIKHLFTYPGRDVTRVFAIPGKPTRVYKRY